MTKEQFDNYRFSVATEIRYNPNGEFHKVVEVDFLERKILADGISWEIDDILEIRENPTPLNENK